MVPEDGLTMANNLFEAFYTEKMLNYSPAPTLSRKGGRARMDRQRYQASLLQITSMTQLEISKLLKISHGTLMNWNMEWGYKALLEKHRKEFSRSFLDEFIKKAQEYRVNLNEDFKLPTNEFTNRKLPRFEWEFFGERQDFNVKTRIEILLMGDDWFKNYPDISLVLLAWWEPIPTRTGKDEKILKAEYLAFHERLHEKLHAMFIENIRHLLLKPSPTTEDKNFILYTMELIRKDFCFKDKCQGATSKP